MENKDKRATGALKSPYDLRTFTTKAVDRAPYVQKGGKRYEPKDIRDQHRVGICTSISLTQNAEKATGVAFSPEFQYLMQKKYYDKNWREGSSAFHALKSAHQIGMLPAGRWTWTTEEDRKLPYNEYIKKLQDIPESAIEEMKQFASRYRIKGYARVAVDRDVLANAILGSQAGIISRFVIGREWYTEPIDPLIPPIQPISGHLVTLSNFNGSSFRTPNTWGSKWNGDGSAYFLIHQYKPTEAWQFWFDEYEMPEEIKKKQEKLQGLEGEILRVAQLLVTLIRALINSKT